MADTPLEFDYSFLKEQGIAFIQQLGGKKWTDYGDHDPGITILEVLAFAIMDLEHRTNFYIEDIWAKNPEAIEEMEEKPFYRAEEILPCNPLTKWDFLKVVLDVPGVKGANIFLSEGSEEIKGGYKVCVEVEDRIRSTDRQQEIIELVKKRLYAQRNLCEDFFLIQVMQKVPFGIKAAFEVFNYLAYEEGETLISKILFDLQEFVSPRITFYSISQLLGKGKTIGQIFTGPFLTQGFIDEEELIQLKNRSRIYAVEFLEKITKATGIKSVLNFEFLVVDQQYIKGSCPTLPVLPDRSLVLDTTQCEIVLTYNGTPIGIDWEKVFNMLEDMKGRGTLTKAYVQEEEVFVLEGNYRQLENYVSIQQDFPLLYNVGHEGCAPSELTENKSKAKQLKSYLMFFDQLFANYLGQLSNVKHVMAIYSHAHSKPEGRFPLNITDFESIVKTPTLNSNLSHDRAFVVQRKYLDVKKRNMDLPYSEEIKGAVAKEYFSYVNSILESNIRSLGKRSRMLDYLLAHFSERFDASFSSLHLKEEEDRLDYLNLSKSLVLKDYIDISRNRSRAASISIQGADEWIHYIPSGFERRLYRYLGIKNLEKRFVHKLIKSNLFLQKNSSYNTLDIFLGKNYQPEHTDCLMFKGKYENIQSLAMSYGVKEEYYNIIKTHHGTYNILLYVDKAKKNSIELLTGHINLLNMEQAECMVQQSIALFSSLNEQCEAFHLIEHILLRESDTLETERDPYSFVMTLVFPSWPARFQQDSFKQAVAEMVITESPAHILTHILWLSFEEMEIFEKAYEAWIQLRADAYASKAAVDIAAKEVMGFIELHTGKSSYPPL